MMLGGSKFADIKMSRYRLLLQITCLRGSHKVEPHTITLLATLEVENVGVCCPCHTTLRQVFLRRKHILLHLDTCILTICTQMTNFLFILYPSTCCLENFFLLKLRVNHPDNVLPFLPGRVPCNIISFATVPQQQYSSQPLPLG